MPPPKETPLVVGTGGGVHDGGKGLVNGVVNDHVNKDDDDDDDDVASVGSGGTILDDDLVGACSGVMASVANAASFSSSGNNASGKSLEDNNSEGSSMPIYWGESLK